MGDIHAVYIDSVLRRPSLPAAFLACVAVAPGRIALRAYDSGDGLTLGRWSARVCGSAAMTAARSSPPAMEGLYRTPFESFERYIPLGTARDVAEFVSPDITAGCTTLNFIPFAGSDQAGVDAVAEVREILEKDTS